MGLAIAYLDGSLADRVEVLSPHDLSVHSHHDGAIVPNSTNNQVRLDSELGVSGQVIDSLGD